VIGIINSDNIPIISSKTATYLNVYPRLVTNFAKVIRKHRAELI
jgi:hypothetical protein